MFNDPVTLIFTRVPKAGCERQWEELMAEIGRVSYNFPGNLGATVLKPRPGVERAYRIIVKFDSMANFQRWESSSERRDLIKNLESMESEPVTREKITGLETWFELPSEAIDQQAMIPPPRYKMMIASAIGVYLTITPLLFFLGPFLEQFPLYISTIFTVVITAVLLTYLVMPLITRILRRWLYGC